MKEGGMAEYDKEGSRKVNVCVKKYARNPDCK
jgi:hypothetical protein